jgi:tetratricopeptide (TPR) repeat protein
MPSPVPVDPRRRPLYGTLPGELPEIAGWSPQGVGLLFQLRQEPIATDRLLEIWENYPRECPDSRRLEDDFFLRELHRNRVAARANLARELIRREELDQALQQTRTAVEMDSAFFGSDRSLSPVWARLYNDLGLALKKGGRDRKAERAYRRAIEMDDRFPDPLRNLGVLNAYRLDRPLEAIGLWERYLELRPGDPEADAIRAEIGRLQNSVNHGYTVDEETSTGERNP